MNDSTTYTSVRKLEDAKPNEPKVTVIFDMWGQRCETVFDVTSELDPLTWIGRMVEKGWMLPVEVLSADGVVLYSEDQLRELDQ